MSEGGSAAELRRWDGGGLKAHWLEITVPRALRTWGSDVAERFGPDLDDLTVARIRQLREPGLLSRLIRRLATASSFADVLSLLPAR